MLKLDKHDIAWLLEASLQYENETGSITFGADAFQELLEKLVALEATEATITVKAIKEIDLG